MAVLVVVAVVAFVAGGSEDDAGVAGRTEAEQPVKPVRTAARRDRRSGWRTSMSRGHA